MDAPYPIQPTSSDPPPPSPPPVPDLFEPLEFHGEGKEYFRIWIVNFFLTVVTLGFYTPWARVRTRRYFYRNTRLAGYGFDYTADPRRLLIGYLIVAVFLVAYFFGEWISIYLSLGSLLVFLALAPWIRWKSVRFRAANSTYRHVRFRFAGTNSEAYRVFLGWPLLAGVTLGLVYPLAIFRQRQFYFWNVRYGGAQPRFAASPGYFFKVVLGIGATSFILGFALIFTVTFSGMFLLSSEAMRSVEARIAEQETPAEAVEDADDQDDDSAAEDDEDYFYEDDFPFAGEMVRFQYLVFAAMAGFYALIGVGALLVHAFLLNHTWSRFSLLTASGEVAFRCRLHPGRYLWIVASNLALTLLTLGLFLPFAKVRSHRYRVSCMACQGAGLLASEVGEDEETVGAVGESASDWLDVEFGL